MAPAAAAAAAATKTCARCHQAIDPGGGLTSCKGCLSVSYCNPECRAVHRPQHQARGECVAMARKAIERLDKSVGFDVLKGWASIPGPNPGMRLSAQQLQRVRVVTALARTVTHSTPPGIAADKAAGLLTLGLCVQVRAAVEEAAGPGDMAAIMETRTERQQRHQQQLEPIQERLGRQVEDLLEVIDQHRSLRQWHAGVKVCGCAFRAAAWGLIICNQPERVALLIEGEISAMKSSGFASNEIVWFLGGQYDEMWREAPREDFRDVVGQVLETMARKALDMARALVPPDPEIVAMCCEGLGRVLAMVSREKEAIVLLRDALSIAQIGLLRQNIVVALSNCLVGIGRGQEAVALTRAELARRPRRGEPAEMTESVRSALLLNLAKTLTHDLGQHEEALAIFRDFRRSMLAKVEGDVAKMRLGGPEYLAAAATIWHTAADALQQLGREEEARQWDQEYLDGTGLLEGASHGGAPLTFMLRRASVLLDDGNFKQARLFCGVVIRRLTRLVPAAFKTPFCLAPASENLLACKMVAALAERLAEVPSQDDEDRKAYLSVAAGFRREVAEFDAIRDALWAAALEEVRAEAQEARRAWLAGAGQREEQRARRKGKKMKRGDKGKGKKGKRGKKKGGGGGGGSGGGQQPAAAKTEVSATQGEEEEAEEQEGEKEQQPEDCAICFLSLPTAASDPYGDDSDEEEDEGEDEDAVTTLTCAHRFHAACLGMWTTRCADKGLVTTCPMCRGPVA